MPRTELTVLALFLVCSGCSPGIDRDAEVDALLALHERVLEAHRQGDVESWMATEADTVVSANRGEVSFSSAEERRAMRERYLGATTFSVYRDLRPPIVHLSKDGTLGWVIAEVEVKGTMTPRGEEPVPVEDVWAWIELYEKQDGVWKTVGNVSNRRP